MHDIISNIANAIKMRNKRHPVDFNLELLPSVGILSKADIFAKGKICGRFDMPTVVSRSLCRVQLWLSKFPVQQPSHPILDLADKEEGFS